MNLIVHYFIASMIGLPIVVSIILLRMLIEVIVRKNQDMPVILAITGMWIVVCTLLGLGLMR